MKEMMERGGPPVELYFPLEDALRPRAPHLTLWAYSFLTFLANYWKNKGWTKWREDKSMKWKATEELLIYIIGQQGLLHKSTAWGFVFTTFSLLQVRLIHSVIIIWPYLFFFWLWFLYLTIRRTIVCITLPHFLSSSFKVPCVHLSSWRSQYSTFPLVHAYYCFFFSIGNCTQKGAFILLRVHNVKFKMPEFNLWGFSSKAAPIDLDMISMF